MLVYDFSHDRHAFYADEPPDRPGLNGFSTFAFQDDRSLGSYAELEFVGLDLGVAEDKWRHSMLTATVSFARGPAEQVERLCKTWLGA